MKFFSLIINELHKSLRNIHIYFDVPLAFELEMNLLYIIKQRQTNNTMKFKTIYDACAELMYEDSIPYIIWITNEEKFGFKPKKVKILVHGNGTYELIK